MHRRAYSCEGGESMVCSGGFGARGHHRESMGGIVGYNGV